MFLVRGMVGNALPTRTAEACAVALPALLGGAHAELWFTSGIKFVQQLKPIMHRSSIIKHVVHIVKTINKSSLDLKVSTL